MKPILAMTAAALLVTTFVTASAQAQDSICEANYAANAAIIAKAQAAATPADRKKVLQDAINANPANAVCIADLALQMSLNIEPAAGDDFAATAELPTTTDGLTPPAENPSQLNQDSTTPSASPVTVVPAL